MLSVIFFFFFDCLEGYADAVEQFSAYNMFLSDSDIEPGLQTKMCLMADAESIASVVDARTDEQKKLIPPFVKAVDTLGMLDEEYSGGGFKVAIEALVLEFWPKVKGCEDLEGLVGDETEVWGSSYLR